MIKLSKKLLIVMLVTMILGATIVNYSNAALLESKMEAQVKENLKEVELEANKPIKLKIEEAKTHHGELVPGANMKLNRAPSFDFEADKENKKIKVTVKDGTGIYTINGTNLDTKKPLKETKIDKKGVEKKELTFAEPDKGKTRFMEYIAKDQRNYSSKVQVKVKNKGDEDTFNVSMRVNFSTDKNHKKLNILLRDNAGINAKNVVIEIYDRNQKDSKGNVKKIKELKGSQIDIACPVKHDEKIVYGMYQLDMSKLKEKDGKRVITVKTTDNDGLKGYRTAEFSF